ncbi:MAG: arginine--tRNA ligase [Thermodesulfobacteriota bacterium]|nr:arginine--tRNA ligase [Thermodesulfobacteriota bacterium]
MKTRLKNAVEQVLQQCYAEGLLTSGEIPGFAIEVPARSDHGDFAVNVAMVLARPEKKAPRQIAQVLVDKLQNEQGLWQRVEIAGPGFINFFLTAECWYGVLSDVYTQGDAFGRSEVGSGRRVQVEFVSANPTGPLHIGHGRGAATGDAVASVLQEVGFDVQREYYINDAGNQMDTLGRSIYLRYCQLHGRDIDFPDDCYQGDYIATLARQAMEQDGDTWLNLPEDEAITHFSHCGGTAIRAGIDDDLQAFGITFDNWYSEQTLYDRGLVKAGVAALTRDGYTYELDGAVWFRTTDFGDDKDRVLIRSNGVTTYFASDVAYHREKYERGFDTVIDVWGADHHGYVLRMKAILSALGRNPEDLQIILVQLVNLLREGEQVAMSTRSGKFVTLKEVLDEVGRDACRFIFLMRRSDSQLDFDLDLAKKQSTENPVFYVQYAHARVCSINRNAKDVGLTLPLPDTVNAEALTLPDELALAKMLARYPEVVTGAALSYEPHRITFYLQELAAKFHSYYNQHRVIIDDVETSEARLYLVNAVKIVLRNALRVLGVSAPEKM